MQPDRTIPAFATQKRQQALGKTQRIGADEMGALGKKRDGGKQAANLAAIGRVTKDRQTKRRLGNEEIAGHHLEAWTGRIGAPLVIAGYDDARTLIFKH